MPPLRDQPRNSGESATRSSAGTRRSIGPVICGTTSRRRVGCSSRTDEQVWDGRREPQLTEAPASRLNQRLCRAGGPGTSPAASVITSVIAPEFLANGAQRLKTAENDSWRSKPRILKQLARIGSQTRGVENSIHGLPASQPSHSSTTTCIRRVSFTSPCLSSHYLLLGLRLSLAALRSSPQCLQAPTARGSCGRIEQQCVGRDGEARARYSFGPSLSAPSHVD